MPSTRSRKQFTVKNTKGETVTVMRVCRGSGKPVQKQLETLYLYDEDKKKFVPNPEYKSAKKKKAKKDKNEAEKVGE